jgi:hypothetical protein
MKIVQFLQKIENIWENHQAMEKIKGTKYLGSAGTSANS